MIAQFVNGALVSNPVRLLLVASFSLVLGAVTPCLLPEADMTLRPLEDGLSDDASVDGDEEPLPFLSSGVDSSGTRYETVADIEQELRRRADSEQGVV